MLLARQQIPQNLEYHTRNYDQKMSATENTATIFTPTSDDAQDAKKAITQTFTT